MLLLSVAAAAAQLILCVILVRCNRALGRNAKTLANCYNELKAIHAAELAELTLRK